MSKRLHSVMLLSNSFRADVRVLKEASSLIEKGHRVTVVAWDRQAELAAEETLESGIDVVRIKDVPSAYGVGIRQLARVPRFWLRALKQLRALEPDIVHCHDFDTLPAGLLFGKLRRIAVIYDAHEYYADLCRPRLPGLVGNLVYHTIRLAENFCARLASAVITVDENLGSIFRRLNKRVLIVGHYPKRTTVGPGNPVFANGAMTLFYVGRLSISRGALIYGELVRTLHNQGISARLRLAGSFTPPQDKEVFLAATSDISEHIELLGVVPHEQVPALMAEADVGLALLQPLPRFEVALPVKLFEYMAAGLPVLISDFPPIAAVYDRFPFGALVDPTDVEAAAAQLIKWSQHPDSARQAGANGRAAILKELNWETLVDSIDQLYQDLCQGR